MANFKVRRMARYRELRARHFSPAEAREFSKLTRKYPALKVMMQQRSAQWAGHVARVKRNKWGEFRSGKEWRKTLEKFYDEKRYRAKTDKDSGVISVDLTNWIVHKDVHGNWTPARPSPWEWYDAVFQGLPDEEKWDTPRSHRRKTIEKSLSIDRVQRQAWIAQLKRTIKKDPSRRADLTAQIKRLGGKVR